VEAWSQFEKEVTIDPVGNLGSAKKRYFLFWQVCKTG